MATTDRVSIIDPTSISFESIRDDLNAYLGSRDDAEAWESFRVSGPGQTMIELMAGMGTMLNFHAMGARRESDLFSLKLKDSAILLAGNLGYPVNRNITPRLKVTLSSSIGSVTWDRTNPFATYGGRNISFLNTSEITSTSKEYEVVVGDWNSYSYVAPLEGKFTRLLITVDDPEKIDNDRDSILLPGSVYDTTVNNETNELYINGVKQTLVKYAEDLITPVDELDAGIGRIHTATHPSGLILSFGDDVIGRSLKKDDVLLFNYLTTNGPLDVTSLDVEDLVPEGGIVVEAVSIEEPGYLADSLDKIVCTAPGYFAAKRRMVTGVDHENILLSYAGDLISAKYKKKEAECCTAQISYLFLDEHIIGDSEETRIHTYLDRFKLVGEKIELIDPVKIGLDFKLDVKMEEGYDANTIAQSITSLVNKWTMKLGYTYRPGRIIRDIGNLDGVVRVYLEGPVSDRSLDFNEYIKLEKLSLSIDTDIETLNVVVPTDLGFIEDWVAVTSYVQDQLVYNNDTIYKAKADFTSGATFDSNNWDEFI